MKLANKQCYLAFNSDGIPTVEPDLEFDLSGLTFQERLIVALASNPVSLLNEDKQISPIDLNARFIIDQADAIIKELEKEND